MVKLHITIDRLEGEDCNSLCSRKVNLDGQRIKETLIWWFIWWIERVQMFFFVFQLRVFFLVFLRGNELELEPPTRLLLQPTAAITLEISNYTAWWPPLLLSRDFYNKTQCVDDDEFERYASNIKLNIMTTDSNCIANWVWLFSTISLLIRNVCGLKVTIGTA